MSNIISWPAIALQILILLTQLVQKPCADKICTEYLLPQSHPSAEQTRARRLFMDSSFSIKDALTFIVYEAEPNKAVLAQAESAREYKL